MSKITKSNYRAPVLAVAILALLLGTLVSQLQFDHKNGGPSLQALILQMQQLQESAQRHTTTDFPLTFRSVFLSLASCAEMQAYTIEFDDSGLDGDTPSIVVNYKPTYILPATGGELPPCPSYLKQSFFTYLVSYTSFDRTVPTPPPIV